MRARVLNFPASRTQKEIRAIYDVLLALSGYSQPMARAHSARLYLSGVLTEAQYEGALIKIDEDGQ